MAQNIFRGLGIALITPFTEDGEVDYKALTDLVEYQIDNNADFLCILATTAEAPCLSREEKDKITKTILEVNRHRVPILKYCGGNNTSGVIDEMRNTDWTGIDGILSICPYYNKPSQEGLYQHFKAIAAESPLPLVLYNVPGRTGVNMKAATTVRLAKDCPNIVAIKEASGSLEQVDEILKNKPRNFEVISGDDALTFSMIASGAQGVISVIGNALPKEFSRMIRLNSMESMRLPARFITSLQIYIACCLSMATQPVSKRCSMIWDLLITYCDFRLFLPILRPSRRWRIY